MAGTSAFSRSAWGKVTGKKAQQAPHLSQRLIRMGWVGAGVDPGRFSASTPVSFGTVCGNRSPVFRKKLQGISGSPELLFNQYGQ